MTSWFKQVDSPKIRARRSQSRVPEGLWQNCSRCHQIHHIQDLHSNHYVCSACNYHFSISARKRVDSLIDRGTFHELDSKLRSPNPLNFSDEKTYEERLIQSEKKTGMSDAILSGYGSMNGLRVLIGAFEFSFMGGSMGIVVGDKITRLFEYGIKDQLPVVIVSASGGARMQEGVMSLMQMAKTLVMLSEYRKVKKTFISVLTHPTTGGVAASFAMRGDVIIAEPDALIGFAGPRVIEQTIKQTLPAGFQRSEFLFEHGLIDMIVDRSELKTQIAKLIQLFNV